MNKKHNFLLMTAMFTIFTSEIGDFTPMVTMIYDVLRLEVFMTFNFKNFPLPGGLH